MSNGFQCTQTFQIRSDSIYTGVSVFTGYRQYFPFFIKWLCAISKMGGIFNAFTGFTAVAVDLQLCKVSKLTSFSSLFLFLHNFLKRARLIHINGIQKQDHSFLSSLANHMYDNDRCSLPGSVTKCKQMWRGDGSRQWIEQGW